MPYDMIYVADIGIHPGNTGKENSENARARQKALPNQTSERWLFGAGDYRFDGTDPIAGSRPAGLDLIRPLWIEGIGGDFNHPRTVFKFPSGTDGIHIHGRIDDLSLNAGNAGISQIGVSARDATMTTVAHGVVVDATCNLSHMLIEFFRGDGVHVLASSAQNVPIEKRATQP